MTHRWICQSAHPLYSSTGTHPSPHPSPLSHSFTSSLSDRLSSLAASAGITHRSAVKHLQNSRADAKLLVGGCEGVRWACTWEPCFINLYCTGVFSVSVSLEVCVCVWKYASHKQIMDLKRGEIRAFQWDYFFKHINVCAFVLMMQGHWCPCRRRLHFFRRSSFFRGSHP